MSGIAGSKVTKVFQDYFSKLTDKVVYFSVLHKKMGTGESHTCIQAGKECQHKWLEIVLNGHWATGPLMISVKLAMCGLMEDSGWSLMEDSSMEQKNVVMEDSSNGAV